MDINLISIKDLAQKLNTPESTIRTWKRNKVIPENCFKKIGGKVFVITNKINKWLDNES